MEHALEIAGLSKKFGSIVVAENLDCVLRLGECLGVIGPNGAGKSSFLNLIIGTVKADAGVIVLGGEEVQTLAPHKRVRKGLGRAFQIPQPFPHLTVYENVLVAATFGAGLSSSHAAQLAVDVLKRTNLSGKSEVLASTLPLIDRKRLEFAKALASKPKVLLLDEIAAGLTEPEVEQLIESVRAAKADHAIIWIEHIPHALYAVADRIMVLDFGRKVLEGPPAEVMKSAVVREVYMGLKADDAA